MVNIYGGEPFMKACMVKLGIFVVMVVLLFGLTAFGLSASADYSSPKDDIYLTLVNKNHRLPVGWEDKIELETAHNFQGEEFQVERETLRHFESLRDDLLLQGIDIELDSTYRTIDGQIDVWEWFRNEGYSDEYCFSHLAIPGFSEHHTGLAIDIGIIKDGVFINDNDEMVAEKEIFAMIHERLADHGFILRYPPDRENSTGYSYEPWHFRYVGEEHAKFITEFGMTLEEYLEMLPA